MFYLFVLSSQLPRRRKLFNQEIEGKYGKPAQKGRRLWKYFFLQLLKSEGPLSNWSNLKRSNIFKNVIFPTSHRRANTRWKLISENMKCYTIFLCVQLSFLSDPSPRSLSCLVSHWARPLVEFCANCWICQSGFDKLINGFLQVIVWIDYMDLLICYGVAKWICFDCCMDLSKLLVVLLALCWSLIKISMLVEASALNYRSRYLMPWVCCAFGNILTLNIIVTLLTDIAKWF